jgi:uncharacterized protein YcbX
MQGEQPASVELTEHGVVGDRVYALVDTGTGKVLSGKTPRLGTLLLSCQAAFIDSPGAGDALPPVQITLPDGTTVISDAPNADATLSGFFERDVTLKQGAPDDFTIDQYHPDVEGLDPQGHRDTVTESRLGAAFFAQLGIPSPVLAGSFLDLFPVSVLTTSTLAELGTHGPESRFDERRFRMNVVVDSAESGFVENGWMGRSLLLGDAVRLMIVLPDPRCVMTTLAQGDLAADNDILRTIVRHNRIEVAGGHYPCAGVYAVVEGSGTVRAGDPVSLVETA